MMVMPVLDRVYRLYVYSIGWSIGLYRYGLNHLWVACGRARLPIPKSVQAKTGTGRSFAGAGIQGGLIANVETGV